NELIRLNREDVLQVTQIRDGERIAISKNPEDGMWYRGGMEKLDSAKAAQYLSQITNVMGTGFAEGPPQGPPYRTLEINANHLTTPLTVDLYATADTTQPFVLHSSANPDAWFTSDSMGLYQRLFTKFDDLLTTE